MIFQLVKRHISTDLLIRRALGALLFATWLAAGCVANPKAPAAAPPAGTAGAAAQAADLAPYLEPLARMAAGDGTQQAAELATLLVRSQESPTAANRLRYAIALGAAGHAGSNPQEAERLVAALLAGPHDLKPGEVELARVFRQEFSARAALHADIARQRDELEHRLQAADADDDKRYASVAAENARLRKALAEAERKLEAVAEMERTLIEQNGATQPNDRPPPR